MGKFEIADHDDEEDGEGDAEAGEKDQPSDELFALSALLESRLLHRNV